MRMPRARTRPRRPEAMQGVSYARSEGCVSARDGDWNAGGEPALRAVVHLSGELAAGGVDVLATRLANCRHDPCVPQCVREPAHAFARTGRESAVGERV